MLQECAPPSNFRERPEEEPLLGHPTFGLGGQLLLPPCLEGNATTVTLSCYWQLFNDLGLTPPRTTMG